MGIDGVGRKKADITQISGGLERKNLKTDQERSIFDAMDTDHNGILTDTEIKDFKKGNSANATVGFDADGDGILTKSEAKKFIKAKDLKNLDIKSQDVIDFLKKYGEYTQNTVSADITDEGIVVNYNDGSKKIINPETKEYKIIKQDANTSATTATSFNADDVLQNEVIENGNEVVTTTFLNGNRDAVKSVVKENKGDNTATVITYDAAGKKIESEVITNNATNEVTTYNYENGIKKGKKVVQGTTETLYAIDGDNEVKTSMIENKGIDAKETHTTWTYNEDNTVTEDITCRGQNLHTVNTLNSENHRLTQTKEINGATYSVEYDGQGNTTGIVIQRDETLKSLAAKFNCSVEDLKKINEGVTFKPGQTIKVPAELDADDERLQNRRSASDIEAEIKREQDAERQRKLAAQRAQNQQLKRLGLINHKGAGQKIKGAYDLGRGKGYREEEFTVIGQASYDRVIARNKKGEIVVLSTEHHKNGWKGPRLVLKTEHVVNTETYRVGKKVNVGGRSVVITDQSRDAHGRMVAVDAQGRTVVVSGGSSKTDLSDRTIVSTSYATASDVADIYNDPQKRAEALKNGTMHLSVVNGEKIVYTRGADGKLWAFKIGANGKLVNQGAVNVNNALDADARAVKSYVGTPHAQDAVRAVAFPEMKNALDRACEDDYSDTRSEDGLRGMSPAEQFLLEESSTRSEGRGLIRSMADAGAYGTPEATSAAIGRISAEEVNYELYGGNTLLGLVNTTHEADVSDALKLCTSPADRLAAEQSIHSIHPEIEADEGSYMRGVIGDETGKLAGYRTAAVDRVIVSWIESGAYAQAQYLRDENGELKLDANGKPMLDPNSLGDQAAINNLIDRMMFAQYYGKDGDKIAGYRNFDDEDYRLTAHNLMSSIGNSKGVADYYVDEHGIIVNPAMECFRIRCADYVKANNLSANVTGEPPEETFIVNMSRSVNTRKLDLEHVEASNRMLYPEQPAFISAEQSVLKARDKGTVHLGASDDPAVYEELKVMLANGEVDGVKSLDDLFTHMTGGNEEMCIRAGARLILYGGVEVEPSVTETIAMHLASYANEHYDNNNDANSDDWNASDAAEDMMLFREMAMTHPEIIPNLRERIHKANFTISGSIAGMDLSYTNMKSKYLAVLNEVEGTVSNETVFLDADGNRITNPELQNEIKARNCELVNEISAEITSMGRDFALKVDQEGGFSDFANNFNEVYGIGTTRADVKTIYGQTRMMQRRLELAAQGKLRDKHGNVISLHDEAKNLQEQLQKLAESTSDYETSLEYTKMGMVLAPIIIATAPVSTSGVVATAVVAGGSTAVVEGTAMMVEHETATTPTSTRAEVMTNIAVRAAEDAAFAAAIAVAGKVINAAGRGVGRGIQYVSKAARAGRINRIRANRLASETPVHTPSLSTDVSRSSDISMLDANKRKLVEDARAAQPTQEELAAYASDHAYQPPTPEQRAIIDQNNALNAQNYADAHRIENVATISHVKPQGAGNQVKALENQIGGLNKKIKSLENRIKNAKAGEDTQALQSELDKLTELRSKKIEELNALKNPTPAEPAPAEPRAAEPTPAEPAHVEPTPEVKPAPKPAHTEPTPEVKPEPKPAVTTPAQPRTVEPRVAIDDDVIIVKPQVTLTQGKTVNIDLNDRIRLGGHVDIDASSLRAKFDSMAEGDEFFIGRSVTGQNDIRINNEFVADTHLKFKKVNGEIQITDLSNNGTVLNTIEPSNVAQYDPEIAVKFKNPTYTDFDNMISDNYSEIRKGNYSMEATVRDLTTQDINIDVLKTDRLAMFAQNGWSWRKPVGRSMAKTQIMHDGELVKVDAVKDRISLNVVADRNLLSELDEFVRTGEYVNSAGQKVKINIPNGYYKTPLSVEKWAQRHDPITMYFDNTLSQEALDALSEITSKYARPSSNGRALMNALDGRPWIAHEAYVNPADAEALYKEALELNDDLARAVAKHLHKDENWNASTGKFASSRKLVDEYRLYNVPAARTPVSPEASVLSKADYDRSIIGLNNSDEISAMRAKIKNDANLTPQEKIQLNNLLDQQEMKLNTVRTATNARATGADGVNVYKLRSNPNAQLKEYSYVGKDGKTYKFIAAVGIDDKNFKFLVNSDYRRRLLCTQLKKYREMSDETQAMFALMLRGDADHIRGLKEILLSVRDEEQLLSIIKNKNILSQKLSDIRELENYFKLNDFRFLGGLLDLKTTNPARYEKIKATGIFELIKDGKLNASCIKKIGVNSDLSSNMYKDLEILKSGGSIVAEFAKGTDLQFAFQQTKAGDAVEIGNKMYLNDGNQLVEWNMTKEKYLELFPPVERFATTQGGIGDCYLIQSMGLAMHNPYARVQFLKSFSLKGDDVIVTVKGLENYHGSITFKDSKITLPKGKHLIGCKGMQMYEQTYARVALRANDAVDYPSIALTDNLMDRIISGYAAQTMSDMFGQGYFADIFSNMSSYTGKSAIVIPYLNNGTVRAVNLNMQKPLIKNVIFDKFFADFPNKSLALSKLDLNTTETLLTHAASEPHFLISFGTVPKPNEAAESMLLSEYNLVSNHAYSILGYNKDTKMVQIANPHAYAEVTEIPLETLHKYIQHLDFIKI